VRLQWQAKPVGAPFDGTGIQSSSALRTGLPTDGGSSIALGGTASGLAAGQRYRWRGRYATRHPNFPRTRWFTPEANGMLEPDLRTQGPTGFVGVEPPAGATALGFSGVRPNPIAGGGEATLHFVLPAAGRVVVEAFDAAGRRVARLLEDEAAAGGPRSVRWSGRDDAGRALAPGLYFLRLVHQGEQATARVVIASSP
jgi:hypothetical protein